MNTILYKLEDQRDGLIRQLKKDGISALRKEEIEMFKKLLVYHKHYQKS